MFACVPYRPASHTRRLDTVRHMGAACRARVVLVSGSRRVRVAHAAPYRARHARTRGASSMSGMDGYRVGRVCAQVRCAVTNASPPTTLCRVLACRRRTRCLPGSCVRGEKRHLQCAPLRRVRSTTDNRASRAINAPNATRFANEPCHACVRPKCTAYVCTVRTCTAPRACHEPARRDLPLMRAGPCVPAE